MMASKGRKVSNSLTQRSNRIHLQKFLFFQFWLYASVKTCKENCNTKNIKGKTNLWKTASFFKETLSKRIKTSSMDFPSIFYKLFYYFLLMEPMSNCHLSQNIFFQIPIYILLSSEQFFKLLQVFQLYFYLYSTSLLP